MNKEQITDNNDQMAVNNEQPANDGEQPEIKRPNANYNLSHPDKPGANLPAEENLVFHYSRERRLAKAPQAVKDLYSESKQTRFNLFRPLVADRPRAMLFGSIVILCAIILFFSNTGVFDNSYVLDGNKIEATGTRFEGATILVLKKTVRTGLASINTTPYTGAINIAVSPETDDEEFPVFYHRIFFTLEKTESYRFAVPFDEPDLLLVLQSEKNNLHFKLKPE